jgi:acetylornithine deacetylase/succinyl-diaminopimelate desuccinylase-like protein
VEVRERVLASVLLMGLAPASAAGPQSPATLGQRLAERPDIGTALARVAENEPWVIERQIALCEIPAPPFGESRRGGAYAEMFRELGLQNVRTDGAGNVLGERPGRAAHPRLVFSAHLDTVFPAETDVRVRREGEVLYGPGIADDCRGLAVLLGVIRALDEGDVTTDGPITFVGTVGEEGLGDLRGVKHLFAEELAGQIDRFVSVDGTGHGGATTVAVGSKRYRVTIRGPGGHSYGAFGLVSPIHALGRAIDAIADLDVPEDPKTTFNVGRIGGGTSINAIAFEAWMEVDLRSPDPAALADIDGRFRDAVHGAMARENARDTRAGALTVEIERVGDRPAGSTPEESPVVLAAASVADALGLPFALGAGSTDSNIGMSLGVPSITIGGGGTGLRAHSLEESFDTTDSEIGTRRALLLAVALASEY